MKLHISKILLAALFTALQTPVGSLWGQSITITSPPNGSVFYIDPDNTNRSITISCAVSGLLTGPLDTYGYAYRLDGAWSPSNPGPPFNTYWPVTGNFSFGITAGEGSHSLRVVLYKFNWNDNLWYPVSYSDVGFTFVQNHRITVQNSFGGGIVKVDGATVASGTSFTWAKGSTHTIEAIDLQNFGGYIQHFSSWSTGASTLAIQINVNANATYTANFLKEFNIAFQNSYPGYGNGGVINVNGAQYNSPTSSFPVRQYNTITGGVVNTYQVINRIEYTFGSWSPGGSTSANTVFTPTDHTTYTANFNAKPLWPENVTAGGAVGEPVHITWTEHPHPSVTQYQIWRIIKPQGARQGDPQLLETVSRGTTSFTDYSCIITETYTHDLVSYDVRAYFSVNGSYSDPNYVSVFANSVFPKRAEDGKRSKTIVPSEYSISNFPNPFNPSTTFSYQLVEPALVRLQIFDVLGRQVAEVVNSDKPAGSHTAVWNGRDQGGALLPSGMYLYQFLATRERSNVLFRHSGKVLLTK